MSDNFKNRRDFFYKLLLAFLGGAGLSKSASAQASSSELKRLMPSVSPSFKDKTDIFYVTDLNDLECGYYGEIVFVSGYSKEMSNKRVTSASGFFCSYPKGSYKYFDGGIIIESINCIWKRQFENSISIEWYGATGDGFTDDTAALAKANAAGALYELPVYFQSGRKYKLSSEFEIDISKTSWICLGQCLLVWAGDAIESAIRLFCSEEGYLTRTVNNKVALSGLSLIGGSTKHLFKSTAILIGGKEKSTALFKIERVNIQGWETNIYFDDNSWRICLSDCQFLWGKIISKENAINSGECMVFSNCILADAFSSTELYQGDWHFMGCSIDNHQIKVFGEASVYFDHGHIENPGRRVSEFVAVGVYSKNSFASITNTLVFMSKTPKVIDTPLFYVAEDNQYLGMYINNLRCDQNENFNPSFGKENALVLIGGKGRVVIDNVQINANNKNYFALSKTTNLVISNPYFSNGLQSWNISGNVVVQNSITKFSKQSVIVENNSSLSQMLHVESNAVLTGGMWVKFVNSYESILIVKIEFLNLSNVVESRDLFNFKAADFSDWTWVRIGAVVPKFITQCELSISLQRGNELADSKVYVDSVILNSSFSK